MSPHPPHLPATAKCHPDPRVANAALNHWWSKQPLDCFDTHFRQNTGEYNGCVHWVEGRGGRHSRVGMHNLQSGDGGGTRARTRFCAGGWNGLEGPSMHVREMCRKGEQATGAWGERGKGPRCTQWLAELSGSATSLTEGFRQAAAASRQGRGDHSTNQALTCPLGGVPLRASPHSTAQHTTVHWLEPRAACAAGGAQIEGAVA